MSTTPVIKVAENGDEPVANRKLSESSDCECPAEFVPLVQLPEVDVKTNEEHETALVKLRAKLYRFDRSVNPAEWKERGTGDLKILRNDENNAVRIVMRRDKTYKVCANHFITPWVDMAPYVANEKAFLYTVQADFADEVPRKECLLVKFGTVEDKDAFKRVFDEAKRVLVEKCCLYNGECDKSSEEDDEDDEVNEKLKELTVDENGGD